MRPIYLLENVTAWLAINAPRSPVCLHGEGVNVELYLDDDGELVGARIYNDDDDPNWEDSISGVGQLPDLV